MKQKSFAEIKARKERKKEHIKFLGLPKIKDVLGNYTTLKKKMDNLFSEFIRRRDKLKNAGLCQVCLRRPIVQCYHIIPATEMGTRWDPENAVGSCMGCNAQEHWNRHTRRDHKETVWIARLGQAKYDELKARSRAKTKYSRDEIQALISRAQGGLF